MKKNKSILLLSEEDLIYLKRYLRIFEVFVKATTKLQAEKYPTLYYLLPEVYSIYTKLENIQNKYNTVSLILYIYKYYTNIYI